MTSKTPSSKTPSSKTPSSKTPSSKTPSSKTPSSKTNSIKHTEIKRKVTRKHVRQHEIERVDKIVTLIPKFIKNLLNCIKVLFCYEFARNLMIMFYCTFICILQIRCNLTSK